MPHSLMEVTGLVLHFRTPQRTLTCLQSLVVEGVRRIVIVDNSEDGGRSSAAMEDGLAVIRSSDVEVNLLSPSRNLGFAGGVDLGLEYIVRHRASHVLLINSDASMKPGSLEHLTSSLAAATVAVPWLSQGGAMPSSAYACYDRAIGLITRGPWVSAVRHPSGCCLLIHRKLIDQPLFDRSFFFYGEDVAFGAFLIDKHVAVVECPEAVVSHSGSASAKNGSMFYEYHMNRAHWLLGRKLASGTLQRVAFTVIRCFSLPLRALVRSFRFRSIAPWRGLAFATADVIRGRCRSFTPPAN